jgi:WhiB family redox-sensing transcriptional regulator
MSDWRELALCKEVDPEAFFPGKGQSTADAKRVCMACEVRTECLADALATGERYGVRGGKSEHERRKLKKKPMREEAA